MNTYGSDVKTGTTNVKVNENTVANTNATGDTVWLALRPEKLSIALEKPAEASANAVEGFVHDIGYLGDLSIYHVRLENGALMKAARPNLSRLVERPITRDDRVWLSWAEDAGVVLTR